MAHPDPDRIARLNSELMPLPDDEMKATVMEMLESGEPTEADVLAIKAMAEQRVHGASSASRLTPRDSNRSRGSWGAPRLRRSHGSAPLRHRILRHQRPAGHLNSDRRPPTAGAED
jgi:hypothetical protein